jgi:predicted hydrocarbon binding protein
MPAEPSLRLKGNYFGDPEFFRTDVTKGVTRTPAGTRICTLPSDFLLGLRDAIVYECGRSYRAVLKAAGRRWGTQFVKRLDRELTAYYQSPFKELPAGLVRVCLAEAFNAHGYGRLTTEPLDGASEFTVADLTDSVMPAIIREADRPVDLLMAGLLAAVFSHLSGKTLDCVQTECPTLGAERCRFLIGPATRLSEVEEWIDAAPAMPSHDDIVRRVLTSQPVEPHAGSGAETPATDRQLQPGAVP